MALSDFTPETIEIKSKRVTFDVRGLSMIDLSAILRVHIDDLEHLFKMYEEEAGNASFSNISMARYATRLISDAPGLVSHIIALAADEPDMVSTVERLPMMTQLDALKAIGKLTFEEVGGVKKLVETLGDLLKEMSPERKQVAKK